MRKKTNKIMKKIGIITIIDNNNYGNRLQNYAMQEILKRYNLDVITINNEPLFNNYQNIKHKIINRAKYIKRKLYKIKWFILNNKRYTSFVKFNKNINITKTIFNINKEHNNFDYLLIGSDQVWNSNFERLSDFDLANLKTNANKLSYAASFGVSEITQENKIKIENALQDFNNISVRENSGAEILRKIIKDKPIYVLLDPTMLLTDNDWDKVVRVPDNMPKGKYILNYFLGEIPEDRKKEIERIANENDCEIINILDPNSIMYQTGPSEFLYLEKNAFLICTDSFHSCVFAILYNVPFIVFDRKENIQSINSRIDTLLEKFELKDRKYNDVISDKQLIADYTQSYKILEKEREKSIGFLKKALEI